MKGEAKMNAFTPIQKTELNKNKIGLAGFQAFLRIAEKWKLKIEQQRTLLGDIPKSTYYKWKHHVDACESFSLPKDSLERISYILGIYKALHILLPDDKSANHWIYKNNSAPLFNNTTALDKMLVGNVIDLADVRRFLDAQRGL